MSALDETRSVDVAEKSKSWQFAQTVGFAFAIVVLQMGQGVLLARLLGPEGRGEYAAAIFYVQMLVYAGLFGGLEVICRHAAEGELARSQLRRSALRLGMVTGLGTTCLVIVLNLIAMPEDKRFLIPLAICCSLSVVGQQILFLMTAVDRGTGEFSKYNARRVFAAAAFPLLLLVAAIVTEINLAVALVLFLAASLASLAASPDYSLQLNKKSLTCVQVGI